MDILDNQVHPVVQVLFPNLDAVFQDNSPIHTASLLWLAQSPDINIMEPLWSVLDSRVISRFPPSSVKQLEEEWYSIPLETIQTLHQSIARRIQAVLQANGGPTPY